MFNLVILTLLLQTSTGLTARLEWHSNPTTEMVKEYQIFRASISGGYTLTPLGIVPHVNDADLFYEDKNLGPGTYFYIIKAVNQFGQSSPPSNEVSGTVPPLPSAPTIRIVPITSAALFIDGQEVAKSADLSDFHYHLIIPKTTPPRETFRLLEVKFRSN